MASAMPTPNAFQLEAISTGSASFAPWPVLAGSSAGEGSAMPGTATGLVPSLGPPRKVVPLLPVIGGEDCISNERLSQRPQRPLSRRQLQPQPPAP